MYQAVIVEDEMIFLNRTKALLADTVKKKNTEVAFDFFTSGQ